METKQLTIHGFDWFETERFEGLWFDADDFGQFIMDCLHCSNMESVDDVYDNLSVFDNGSAKFNLFPNTKETVSVLEKSAKEFSYIIFGNWIVTYDIPDSIWYTLDDMNLIPYYGYGYKFAEFPKNK